MMIWNEKLIWSEIAVECQNFSVSALDNLFSDTNC